MSVDIRCLDILVPQQLLPGGDIVSRFKQMRGKAVAEDVRVDRLIDLRQFHIRLYRLLQPAGIQVVAVCDSPVRLYGQAISRKHMLSGQLFISIRVFTHQGERRLHRAKAICQIAGTLLLYRGNLGFQRFYQADGQPGKTVLFALAGAHFDLGLLEVNILDMQGIAVEPSQGVESLIMVEAETLSAWARWQRKASISGAPIAAGWR